MNKDMEELREAVANRLWHRDHPAYDDYGWNWKVKNFNHQIESYLKEADSFLEIETGNLRIAVVEKESKLPDIPDFQYDKPEDWRLLKRGAINYSKLFGGWFKEYKEGK